MLCFVTAGHVWLGGWDMSDGEENGFECGLVWFEEVAGNERGISI